MCRDLTRRTYLLAIACGDLATPEPLLARVHSSCVTSESLGGCDCDCAEQLDAALAAIAAAGRGVVFYLDQEGRGAGFVAKVRDRMLVQASGGRLGTFEAYAQMGLAGDLRSYEAVAAAYALLGIGAPLVLLTNNPEKLAAVTALGVPVAGSAALALPPSPFNRHYLAAKTAAGHRLAVTRAGAEAEPPEPVEIVTPYALAAAPSLMCMGSYWLPIRMRTDEAPTTHWIRLHAYVDLRAGASTSSSRTAIRRRRRCSCASSASRCWSVCPDASPTTRRVAMRRPCARSSRTARGSWSCSPIRAARPCSG